MSSVKNGEAISRHAKRRSPAAGACKTKMARSKRVNQTVTYLAIIKNGKGVACTGVVRSPVVIEEDESGEVEHVLKLNNKQLGCGMIDFGKKFSFKVIQKVWCEMSKWWTCGLLPKQYKVWGAISGLVEAYMLIGYPPCD